MANLILPHRWRRQPQYPVQVDRDNPLMRGMVSLVDLRGPRELLGGNSWTWSAAVPWKITKRGVAGDLASSNFGSGTGNIPSDYPFSYAIAAITAATVTTPVYAGMFKDFNSNAGWYFDIEGAGGNVSLVTSSNANWVALTITASEADGTPFNGVAVWHSDVDVRGFYRSDTKSVSATANHATRAGTGITKRLLHAYGGGASASNFPNTPLLLAAFWNRGLSDAEAYLWNENPWQVFKPLRRRIHVHVEAGGGGGGASRARYITTLGVA